MNGTSCAFVMWLASPENTANSTLFGTDEVTTASTNAIEMTAPVFWTSTPALAANALRSRGTVPIVAAVGGELNMPTDPTMNMCKLARYVVSRSGVVVGARPTAWTGVRPAPSARATPVRPDAGHGEEVSVPIARRSN